MGAPSKISKIFCVSFPNDVAAFLHAYTEMHGTSVQNFVREATFAHLKARGIDIPAPPEVRAGVRMVSDIERKSKNPRKSGQRQNARESS